MQLDNYSLQIGKKKLFSNVTMEFEKGSICNVLGGNGVGKSSFAKSLINVLKYTGSVRYEGSLCVIGSYTNIPTDLTINDLVDLIKRQCSLELFNELYAVLRIEKISHTLKIGKLSDGQKQKLKLLFFLITEPDVIILDEFTSSLDKNSMIEIYAVLKAYNEKKEKLIINITHNMMDLQYLEGKYYYVTNKNIILYTDKEKILEDYMNLK